jgi:hypothetical protein
LAICQHRAEQNTIKVKEEKKRKEKKRKEKKKMLAIVAAGVG